MSKNNLTYKTPGAPFGGRVHNIFADLPGDFMSEYELTYNYQFKNYMFYRRTGYLAKNIIDVFIIVKTSRRCYRVNYCNSKYLYFCNFSAQNSKELADIMYKIFKTFERVEK